MPKASPGDIRAGRAFIEIFSDDSKLQKGLLAASARVRAWSRQITAIGRQALTAAVTVGAPLAFSTRTFTAFEDQMKAVQAVSGATGKEFDKLYEKAKLLGRSTSFTAAQVAEGMLNLARAGFDTQEIDDAIAGMLDLARATGTDLATAADIAAGTLRAFGLDATQSTHVADVLTATANNSAQTLEDLGDAMKYVAPIAEEYGLSLEETAKAVGALANMQIKGSMAGTSLRQMMLRLADPKVQESLASMGVSVRDLSGNLRTDFGTMLAEIGQAAADLPTGDRLALFTELFDQRAAGAAAKLAKSSFPALIEAIDNADGAAARTAKVIDSGLGGAFRRMLSAIEGIQVAIGEALAPIISDIADKIAEWSEAITKWIKDNRQVIVIIGGIVAGLAVLGAILMVVGMALIPVAALLSAMAFLAGVVGSVLAVLAIVIKALLSPIGLLAAGLAALIWYFSGLREVAATASENMGKSFAALKQIFSRTWKGIGDAIAAGDLSLAFKVAWSAIKMVWLNGVNWLLQKWIGFKKEFLNIYYDAVYSLAEKLTNVWAGIQGTWVEVTSFMAKAWADFSHSVVSDWRSAQNWIAKKIVALMGMFDDSLDVAQAQAILDEDFAREQAERDREHADKIEQIEKDRVKRQQDIEDERSGAIDALQEEHDRKQREREAEYNKQLQEAQAAADKARQEWLNALAEAERRRKQGGDGDEGEPAKNPVAAVGKAAGFGLAAAEKVGSSQGTFNAFAAAMFAHSTNPLERAARAGEETAKNTRDLVRDFRDRDVVFV